MGQLMLHDFHSNSLDSVFEIDAITRAYFPGREHGGVYSGALVVLLNDTFQDLGGGFGGGGIEPYNDAAHGQDTLLACL
jgi:hypothetical protein